MKKKYNYKKTLKKIVVAALAILIAGLSAEYANNQFVLGIIPILVGFQNWYKHKNN